MSEPPAVSKMNEADASLSERFVTATALVDSSPEDAVSHLQELQKQVAALALFSTNEGIEDMSTKSLPLLALEFHLAMAHLACRAQTSRERKTLVGTSIDLFSSFLQRLEELELLSKEHTKDYHDLLDMTDNEDDKRSSVSSRRTQGQQREAKIARFRAKQQAQKEVERLKSLQQRRGRLETLPEEEMDGFDEESLERQVAIQNLNVHAAEALDEWFQAQRELPMIEMAIQMEERKSAARIASRSHARQQEWRQETATTIGQTVASDSHYAGRLNRTLKDAKGRDSIQSLSTWLEPAHHDVGGAR